MSQSSLRVSVRAEDAMANGVAEWGDIEVDMGPILQQLEPEECMRLGASDKGRLLVDDYIVRPASSDPDHVVEAIRQRIENTDQWQAARHKRLAESAREKIVATEAGEYKPATEDEITVMREEGLYGRYEEARSKLKAAQAERLAKEKAEAVEWTKAAIEYLSGRTNVPVEGITRHTRIPATAEMARQYRAAYDAYDKRMALQRNKALKEWALVYGSEDVKAAITRGYPFESQAGREAMAFLRTTVLPSSDFRILDATDARVEVQLRSVPSQEAYEKHEMLESFCSADEMQVSKISRISLSRWVKHDCDEPEYCDECDSDGEILHEIVCTGAGVTIRVPFFVKPVEFLVTWEADKADEFNSAVE